MTKKLCLLTCILVLLTMHGVAQTVADKLRSAVKSFENDAQMRHALVGFYVADARTGKVVFAKNEQLGMAAASTQKIITSACAYELLGKYYKFSTFIRYHGTPANGKLPGNLYIVGNGDPTLGSWRFNATSEQQVVERIAAILEKKSITHIAGDIVVDDISYTFQPVPDGWIWQDIGNYYGAGSWGLNWRENQYDLVLQSGNRIGDTTKIVRTIPVLTGFELVNYITAAEKGSGDNGYIYASPFASTGFATGTIPAGERAFTISGSMPLPALQFASALREKLSEKNIALSGSIRVLSREAASDKAAIMPRASGDSISSPVLDSMNYWFMKKSINLYGEAFLKAIGANQEQGVATTTEKGIRIVKQFWSERGIDKSALNIMDGSGLSPQNRITAHSLVQVLLYARQRGWYQSFYHSLPVYNGMKIKSGSIGGARSFAGYHTSASGNDYVFAIIVNNYDGSSSAIVGKMYKVLDGLK